MIHARSDYNERIQDAAGLIPADEPVLLIRGQDACALKALQAWCIAAVLVGADEALVEAMQRHADRIVAWQAAHAVKVPDAPAEALA